MKTFVNKHRWMVMSKRDADPVEVFPFAEEDEALAFYEQASIQWTEVYLMEICAGPRDFCDPVDRTKLARAEAARAELLRAAEALVASLGEMVRQTMHATPEWRDGIAAIEDVILRVKRDEPHIRRAADIGRISLRPGVVGGSPCIAGTRLTTSAIKSLWDSGNSVDRIHALYPSTEMADIQAALALEIFMSRNTADLEERAKTLEAKIAKTERELDLLDRLTDEQRDTLSRGERACPVHDMAEHGKEAEELRGGVETILEDFRSDPIGEEMWKALETLLESVDARDSLAFTEKKVASA